MGLIAERASLLKRYRQLRGTMRDLHSALLETLSKDTLTRCGGKLGFMVDGTLVFESEDESSALIDYSLYEEWSEQHNAISRYLAKQPYDPGSDEFMLLEGMSRARCSLFQVESVAAGLGVNCRDLLRGDVGSIVDEGLGKTATLGVVFACHLVVVPELSMTTGAALPIDGDTLVAIHGVLKGKAQEFGRPDRKHFTREEQAEVASIIIRCALRREPSSRLTNPAAGRRPSRNEACPCGSGRKFKRCCGRAS
ncbi:MAG: SEC-C metal-binding domain-containing protein [Gammaproteobacteria bacterium]